MYICVLHATPFGRRKIINNTNINNKNGYSKFVFFILHILQLNKIENYKLKVSIVIIKEDELF